MLQGRRGGREGAHSALRPAEEPEKQPPQGVRNPGNWCPRSQADGSRREGGSATSNAAGMTETRPDRPQAGPRDPDRARARRGVGTCPGSPDPLPPSGPAHGAALPGTRGTRQWPGRDLAGSPAGSGPWTPLRVTVCPRPPAEVPPTSGGAHRNHGERGPAAGRRASGGGLAYRAAPPPERAPRSAGCTKTPRF